MNIRTNSLPGVGAIASIETAVMVAGTVIVFGIAFPNWETGEFKAFHRFVEARGLKYR